MSNKLDYSEHTRCNQKHCLREAESSPLQAGLDHRPKGTAIARGWGAQDPICNQGPPPGPRHLPSTLLGWWPPTPALPLKVGVGSPQGGGPVQTTLPGDHKFMNPRSFARSGQEQSLAAVGEDIFLCQATERSTKTPAARPQTPSL